MTKEFVPSSGKPGRKGSAGSSTSHDQTNYKRALAELEKQREENRQLQEKIAVLEEQIKKLSLAFDAYAGTVEGIRRGDT